MKLFRISWIAVRELLYERVFYVLLSFAIVSLGLSLIMGQLTYADQVKLTLDFMLAGSHLSMALFSIFVGILLFQRELVMGSVSMVLAKPVSRTTFLLGKYFGQTIVQGFVTLGMGLLTLVMCQRPEGFSALAVLQTVTLIFLEVSVLTAITYFFAVNSGSITTAVATICFFCVGHLRESVTQNMSESSLFWGIWTLVKNLIPNLEVFNMKALASYGIAMGMAEFMWASLYALICISFFLICASLTFQQKDVLT